MKKNCIVSFGLALALSCLATSCKQENLPEQITDPVGDYSLVCDLSEAEISTKVGISWNNHPLWQTGDRISVLSPGINNEFTLTDGAGTETGTFTGLLGPSELYCALYPYQSAATFDGSTVSFSTVGVQSGVAQNLPVASNPMVARFTFLNPHPSFHNVFGLLELQLSGSAAVGKITITSKRAQDKLWGDFTLTTDGQLSATGGSNELSVLYTPVVQLSETNPTPFYFSLPAGTLSSGFTVTVYDGFGKQVFTKATTKTQTIERSSIKLMEAVSNVDRLSDLSVEPQPLSWAAYNNMARSGSADQTVIDPENYPASREKYVGAFYFIWHNMTTAGPYDVQKYMGEGQYDYVDVPQNNDSKYGPLGSTSHWGEPYLGYYKADDSWVLRKHAQMLVDAGVDFIAFDVTNNTFYDTEIAHLCDVYLQMREEGNKTPQITFMVWHSGPNGTGAGTAYSGYNHDWAVQHLYQTYYTQSKYSDLWFRWEGKPLMLALRNTCRQSLRDFFTFRACWYLWNQQAQTPDDVGDPWWTAGGTTEDKWPWGVCYIDDVDNPMRAGTHNGVNEFCSVAPATHPVSNIGRSYPVNSGITYKDASTYLKQPEKGIYFHSQFNAAMELDPKIMFFTGWNEWLMGHYTDGVDALQFYYMCGVHHPGHMFVDQFNHEFSRDIEPLRGNYGDTYYYYMSDFIRQFKGSSGVPVFSRTEAITIDGNFSDWASVNSCYADDIADTKWRGYDGNSGNGWWNWQKSSKSGYVNKTGRNDLRISKVATDGANLYFYISATSTLTDYAIGNKGLNLLIKSAGSSSWEGFNYMISPNSASRATLSRLSGSDSLVKISIDSNVSLAASGSAMEVAIPFTSIGITDPNNFSIDFKWVDNVDLTASDGIQQCMSDGDSAPNGRFRYRYVFRNQ